MAQVKLIPVSIIDYLAMISVDPCEGQARKGRDKHVPLAHAHTGSAGAKDQQVCAMEATAPHPILRIAASDVEGAHLQSQDGQCETLAGIQARRERARTTAVEGKTQETNWS